MDLQEINRADPANVDKGNKGKAVAVKRKRRRKKATENAATTSKGPSNALNVASTGNVLSVQTSNEKTVLDNVGKGKKKRRKKQKTCKGKKRVRKTSQAKNKTRKAIGKTNLKASADISTETINDEADKGFNGPSYGHDTTDFRKFNNTEVEIFNKGVLNNDARGSQAKTEPEVHKVEAVHSTTINKELVKWEHLALIIEEHFITKRRT